VTAPVHAVHWTPEEEDQPACDADISASPSAVMYGTLNPRKVTCPECQRILGAYDMAPGQ
jgi:hypothetical protein